MPHDQRDRTGPSGILQGFGATTEIMKEIIGHGLGLQV